MYCTVCSVDQTPEIILNTCYSSASTCHEYSGPMRGNMCLVCSLTVYMELTEVTSQLQGFPIGACMFNSLVLKITKCTLVHMQTFTYVYISNSPVSISDLILVQRPHTSTTPHSGLFTGRSVATQAMLIIKEYMQLAISRHL